MGEEVDIGCVARVMLRRSSAFESDVGVMWPGCGVRGTHEAKKAIRGNRGCIF